MIEAIAKSCICPLMNGANCRASKCMWWVFEPERTMGKGDVVFEHTDNMTEGKCGAIRAYQPQPVDQNELN